MQKKKKITLTFGGSEYSGYWVAFYLDVRKQEKYHRGLYQDLSLNGLISDLGQ